MNTPATRSAALILLALATLFSAGCATTGGARDESEPTVIDAPPDVPDEPAAPIPEPAPLVEESKEKEGEVPLAVAESEPEPADASIPEVVVEARVRLRHEAIVDLVTEAQTLLRDFELHYVFTGKGKRRTLRGRPVAFALWSEVKQEWTIAELELPRPPVKWKPGRKPLPFRSLTPGI